MMHLHLSEKSVFPWEAYHNTHVCGYGYIDGRFLQGADFARELHFFLEQKTTCELLEQIEGCFAFIHQKEDGCIAATDHIRSIPLFYAQEDGDFYISDDAEWIRASLQLSTIDRNSAAEFLIAHFVTGSETLIPEIRQLRAGDFLEYVSEPETADPVSTDRYYSFFRNTESEVSEDDLIEQLDQVHLTVFNNLIESLNGRQAVVPLSGGFDSRLIAIMIHRLDYDHLKFISYGRPGNWEGRIAKEVADHLGVTWQFIPLNQKIWFDAFRRDERADFTFSAGNLSSHTIIQEYPVIQILKQNNIVEEDAVFIPGHSGGFTSGAHIPDSFLNKDTVDRVTLYRYILNKNYRKWNWENSAENFADFFRAKIHHLLDAPDIIQPEHAAALYEQWIWQERQAKFIVNSVRNFEHYGFEWRLPLWHKQLVDFWQTVPVGAAFRQKLLKKYMDDKISLPVTPPNSPRLAKVIDRYHPTAKAWIGRYIGTKNLLQAINIKLKDVLPVDQLPYDFIPSNKRVMLADINALGSLQYMVEIIGRTEAKIS